MVVELALFGRRPGEKATPVGNLRLSMPTAKELSFILRKIIREVEEREQSPVIISNRRLGEMKIAPEDWNAFWK
jgi:hypothetical protein